MKSSQIVSVVIPTYNRANILEETLPSYLQPEVEEVIVVDDCSSDNTQEVLKNLSEKYPRIKYVLNQVNSKQGFTKNRGIEIASCEYIYFGDDDSFILPGTITRLLQVKQEYNADIVGAKALYMTNESQISNIDAFVEQNNNFAKSIDEIVDISTLHANFALSYKNPVEVPFTQACFIVSTQLAKEILFDIKYQGNAYREETDFLVRASLAGKRIMYDSSVVQINLPRQISKGGAHNGTSDQWYESSIENNNYFLDKNYAAMQTKWRLPNSIEKMREIFLEEMTLRYKVEHKYDWLKQMGLYTPLRRLKQLIIQK